jgi:hypothetical protein
MLSRIRGHLTYANVAMTLALVFAMSGGAYAAKHYLITSTKQISPKVLKQLQGKAGKAGVNGANGANGLPGKEGALGKEGAKGEPGTNGKDGKDGVSVTSSTEPKGGNCPESGSKFTAANGVTYACNGKEGLPWTDKGLLPKGSSEKGVWGATGWPTKGGSPFAGGQVTFASLSFTIPLETAPVAHVIGVGEGAGEGNENVAITSGECKGNFKGPGAAEGNLCVFETEVENVQAVVVDSPETNTLSEASKTGSVLYVLATSAGYVHADGVWAVTA